jgi:hypothetical protein
MLRMIASLCGVFCLLAGNCLTQTGQVAERPLQLSDPTDSAKSKELEIRVERQGLWGVLVTVNNNSQSEITLSGLTLYLTPWTPSGMAADAGGPTIDQGYYAPVNLETRKGLALRKTTRASGVPVVSTMKIAPHEVATLDIDMMDVKWGCNICGNWPYQRISKAVKAGDYELYVEVFVKGTENAHRSNAVPFTNAAASGAKGKTK